MGWTYGTVYADNVIDAFKKNMLPRKYYKDSKHTETIESEIIRLEFNGNNAFILEKVNNKYYVTSYLLKYSKRYWDFGYKDMGFFGAGNSCLASKTMIELVKKFFDTSTPYFKETIKEWENYNNKQKENKEKRQNLKVGDVVVFPNCNYGGRGNDYKWTVTSIDGNNVYFNYSKLRNWKKQHFEIVA